MKILVAIPCMDMVHTSFLQALIGLRRVGDTRVSFQVSSLVYDARNNLAKQAVTEGYDRVLWLDSDMVFAPDFLERLSADMDEGREMVCGLYFKRRPNFSPVIYKELNYTNNDEKMEVNVKLTPYEDYPKDDIFKIAACGFAGVLMSTDLINRIGNAYGLPFSPAIGLGEDLSFCLRAGLLGAEMYCDSRAKMGHVGFMTVTEETYLSTR